MTKTRIKITRVNSDVEYIYGIGGPEVANEESYQSILPEAVIALSAGDTVELEIASDQAGVMGSPFSGEQINKYAQLSISVLG